MATTVLLGDGSEQSEKLFHLLSQEFTFCVKADPLPSELTLTPELLRGFNTVVLYPADIFPPLLEQTQQTICEFVNNGGLLVAMPFTAWTVARRGNTLLGSILPVNADAAFYEGESLYFDLAQEEFQFFQKLKMAGNPLWIAVTTFSPKRHQSLPGAGDECPSVSSSTRGK